MSSRSLRAVALDGGNEKYNKMAIRSKK